MVPVAHAGDGSQSGSLQLTVVGWSQAQQGGYPWDQTEANGGAVWYVRVVSRSVQFGDDVTHVQGADVENFRAPHPDDFFSFEHPKN